MHFWMRRRCLTEEHAAPTRFDIAVLKTRLSRIFTALLVHRKMAQTSWLNIVSFRGRTSKNFA